MRYKPTDKLMAVKRVRALMNRYDTNEVQAAEKRLKREIHAIQNGGSCPQIVQFYGALMSEGDCVLCMELMDTSLEKLYLAVYENLREKFPENIIGFCTVSVLQALNHLKSNLSIIHRDVKPSNILLDKQGRIKLCDFGISGFLINSLAYSKDVGCRPYMAPERLQSSDSYDIRSDVWSLGITLVEVATGQFPFTGFNKMPIFQQFQVIVQGDSPKLPANNRYSSDFNEFVSLCLIKDKEHRPKYAELMQKPFYKRYAQVENAEQLVAKFVEHGLSTKTNVIKGSG